MIEEFMRRPDIPMAGAEKGYVEDIVGINAVDKVAFFLTDHN